MKKYFLLINPAAGRKNNSSKTEKILNHFKDSGYPFEYFFTSQELNAEALVRQKFTADYTHLIIAGGDGTIHECINGLKTFDIWVGIIPLGTGNDFVKNLDLPENLDYLFSDRVVNVSIGKYNERYFINGIGAGFDGQIIRNMLNHKGILTGHAAYLSHVIRILGTFRERRVKYSIDGKEFESELLLILAANGTTFGGGFILAPQADVTENCIDVCIIKKIHPLKRFMYLPLLQKGKHGRIRGVEFFKAKSLRINGQNLHGQVDGEYAGSPPFHIEITGKKLKILTA